MNQYEFTHKGVRYVSAPPLVERRINRKPGGAAVGLSGLNAQLNING